MYYAHSKTNESRINWQTLKDHLENTAELAAEKAAKFGAGQFGYAAGLKHDIGKYTASFQAKLDGASGSVNHSTAGAVLARQQYYGKQGLILAYAIAGHHAGLANGAESGRRGSLLKRLATPEPSLDEAWKTEIQLPDGPLKADIRPSQASLSFQYAFFIRMLFSCLVDADYLDTEAFYTRLAHGAAPERGAGPSLGELRNSLNKTLNGLDNSRAINQRRSQILEYARSQAGNTPGRFTLMVPTGGGKTLTSLAFALDHAIANGMDRVIYVIPYTNIIEQTADVFREALGANGQHAVLEHHSAFDDTSNPNRDERTIAKLRRDSENWNAPIVVTTSVQFFESLYATRPSQCRKLHNIAKSVVILDEAQTLPLPLLRPCVTALDELAHNYNSSIVLCTATQPALEQNDDPRRSFPGGFCDVIPLVEDSAAFAREFERVIVKYVGTLDDDQLCEEMQVIEQVLCIVNNRRHARALFKAVRHLPGIYHLTTSMCAAHRRQVLARIRHSLANGEACRVVATSLVEAGVDLDFPRVLRAEAGLESIAQAAGRCNRENKRPVGDSEVRIFAPQNPEWAAPPELCQQTQAMQLVINQHPNDSPLSPRVMDAYFRTLYWQQGEALDAKGILDSFRRSPIDSLPFETVDDLFRMIESTDMSVIVPFDDRAREAIQALQEADRLGDLPRCLQRYTVQVPQKAFEALRCDEAIAPVNFDRFGEQFMALTREAQAARYDENSGLEW